MTDYGKAWFEDATRDAAGTSLSPDVEARRAKLSSELQRAVVSRRRRRRASRAVGVLGIVAAIWMWSASGGAGSRPAEKPLPEDSVAFHIVRDDETTLERFAVRSTTNIASFFYRGTIDLAAITIDDSALARSLRGAARGVLRVDGRVELLDRESMQGE